jgi:hypothetical protein
VDALAPVLDTDLHPEVQVAAAVAMAKFRSAEALAAVRRALADRDPGTRRLMVRALDDLDDGVDPMPSDMPSE